MEELHTRLDSLERTNAELTARVNELQRIAHIVNGLMDRIEVLEQNVKPKGDAQEIDESILSALDALFLIVNPDMAFLPFSSIFDALNAGGLQLRGPLRAQQIAVARAMVAFGAKPSRDRKGRIYRGIVKRGA